MTVQEFQAERIESMARLVAHFLENTQEDRREWVPQVEGAAGLRCALDQVSECIHVNRMFAGILRGQEPPAVGPLTAPRPFENPCDAAPLLIESAVDLAAAVRDLRDEDLHHAFMTRRGPMPGHMVIEIPYRNMAYHGGQINMLQLLYGDTEFRYPSSPSPKQE
jgi:hypothetical protein